MRRRALPAAMALALLALACADPSEPDVEGVSDGTLRLEPASLSIARGAQGTTTVAVEGGCEGMSISVTRLPAGVTASFDEGFHRTCARQQYQRADGALRLTVSAGAPTGTHSVLVTGRAPGYADRSATLSLTITP